MGTLRKDGFASMRSIGATAKPDVLKTLAVDLPEFADESVTMKASSGETLSLIPRGMRHARFRNEQGTVVADSVADGVDALWSAAEDRAEIYYVLRKPSAPHSFQFDLEAEDIAVETEGTIAIKHGDRVALRIPRPFAIDANGLRRDAGMHLEGKRLFVDLDTNDLAYPIVLDPGVETATWTKMGAASPFPRESFCAAEAGGKLLLFGGDGGPSTGTYYNETWEFDGTAWTKRLPATSPTARYRCYMTARAGRPTMFGGNLATGGSTNETWEWNGSNWTQLSIGAGPNYRQGAAFSSNGSQILYFGGARLSDGVFVADTWTFDGTSWTWYGGTQPAARYSPWIAGTVTGGVLVAGGADQAYNPFYDSWIWTGTAWSKKADVPAGIGFTDGTNGYLNYDAEKNQATVFDGSTWTAKTSVFSGGVTPKRDGGFYASATGIGPSMGAITTNIVFDGASAHWMFANAKGEGWPTVQKLAGGSWSIAGEESAVPAGALGSEGADPVIVAFRPNVLGRTWKLSSGAWTSTTATLSANVSGPFAIVESGGSLYAARCASSSTFEIYKRTAAAWSLFVSGSASCGPYTSVDPYLPAHTFAASASGDLFFLDARIVGTTVSSTSVGGFPKLATYGGVVHNLDASGNLSKWSGSGFTPVPSAGTTSADFVASVGSRLVALRKSVTTGAYDTLSIFNGTSWRSVTASGGPQKLTSFSSAGSRFYGQQQLGTTPLGGPELWSLDIGFDLGTSCTLNSDCTSGHCTDGVCCDVASCGAGSSCNASAKGSCRKLDGTTCATPGECSSGFCEGSVCCKTACDLTTHTCGASGKAGTCLKVLGQPATAGSECTSGVVADSVCCDAACTGKCVSCKKSDTTVADGTCAPVTSGTDPASECPDPADPNSCGPDGLCDGSGACRVFAPVTKTCGMATCAAGVVDGHHCNASGTCIVGTSDCGKFVCADASNCLTACTTAADCKTSGMLCIAGDCVPPAANGTACTKGDECASKNCVDGVCCNNACDGQCQACNVAGSAGTCSAVKGDPVGGRAPCNGGGTACAGTCDGVGAACTYPSFGTDCGTNCTDGSFIDKKCDNKGACVEKIPVNCNNYACDTTGCKNSCTTVADCASNTFDCVDNKCIPQATAQCAPDGIHIQQGDAITDCSPQRCKGGKCVTSCIDSTLDCVPGYVCGADGKCTPAPVDPPPPPSDNCGCSTKPAPFSTSAAIALLAIATSIGRRVRRGRRDV